MVRQYRQIVNTVKVSFGDLFAVNGYCSTGIFRSKTQHQRIGEWPALRIFVTDIFYIQTDFLFNFTPDGIFGPRTRDAVISFQEEFGLPINGRVGAITWAAITDIYEDIARGAELGEGQYPGFELGR